MPTPEIDADVLIDVLHGLPKGRVRRVLDGSVIADKAPILFDLPVLAGLASRVGKGTAAVALLRYLIRTDPLDSPARETAQVVAVKLGVIAVGQPDSKLQLDNLLEVRNTFRDRGISDGRQRSLWRRGIERLASRLLDADDETLALALSDSSAPSGLFPGGEQFFELCSGNLDDVARLTVERPGPKDAFRAQREFVILDYEKLHVVGLDRTVSRRWSARTLRFKTAEPSTYHVHSTFRTTTRLERVDFAVLEGASLRRTVRVSPRHYVHELLVEPGPDMVRRIRWFTVFHYSPDSPLSNQAYGFQGAEIQRGLIRVKFEGPVPTSVWWYEGAQHEDVPPPSENENRVLPDLFGYVEREFLDPPSNVTFGLHWEW